MEHASGVFWDGDLLSRWMDLPRFRGEVRSWDQGTWFDCIVSSLDHPMGSDRRPELGGDLSGRYTGDVCVMTLDPAPLSWADKIIIVIL